MGVVPAEVVERVGLPEPVTAGLVPGEGLLGVVHRVPVPALPDQSRSPSSV
jgi:hypothetical protein